MLAGSPRRPGAGLVFYEQSDYTEFVSDCERRTPPMMIPDVEALKERINQLHIEHRDLDDVISRLSQSPAQDQLQLQRLKKRKLYLKDQIALLERQLTPDIPA